jgi:hypothetical protein
MDPEQLLSMAQQAGFQTPPISGSAETAPAIDRRSCVRLFISLLGVLSLNPSLSAPEDWLAAADLQSWLRNFGPSRLGDPEALSQLGAIYLALHPGERELERLSRLILRDSAAPVKSVLIESIARDWSKHDVTQLAGWVLSRTEARICAVLHLTGGRLG